MQWEMILLLVLAGQFVVYWATRYGIARLKKKTAGPRK